jgi:UDPglucose 6-dehydrogenase
MKVVIAGYGFVGQAVDNVIKKHHSVLISDPAKGLDAIYYNADAVIICVATPQADDGSCYINNVLDVLAETPIHSQVLIKSTISIEGWDLIKEKYPEHNIVFSPEFLRAASAVKDFAKQEHMYLGGEHDAVEFWINFFRGCGMSIIFEQLSPKEAILIKCFRNSFLATKVAFFNQVHDMCESLELPYHVVQRGIGDDHRIGRSHTHITNERGFGGHCFPKDTSALLKSAEQLPGHVPVADEHPLSILQAAVKYNNKIRK